jgi:hypothetical protein
MTFFYAAAGGLDHRAAYLFRAGRARRGVSVPLSPPATRAMGRHVCSSCPQERRICFLRPLPTDAESTAARLSSRPKPDAAHLFPSPVCDPGPRPQSGASVPSPGARRGISAPRPPGVAHPFPSSTPWRTAHLFLSCEAGTAYLFRADAGGAPVPRVRTGGGRSYSLFPPRAAGRGPTWRVCSPARSPRAAYLFRSPPLAARLFLSAGA